MNINNTNPSSNSSGIEPTKTNKTQTSDNVKKSNPEQSALPNTKSSTVISNSKLQEGNFAASFQSAKLQSMVSNRTSSNTNAIATSYEAQQIIKANTSFFNLDETRLGKTLATIAKQQPSLVKETFQQLSSGDKVQVAQAFVDELASNNGLKDLAKSPEGNKLLLETYNILSNQQSSLSLLIGKSDPRLEVIGKALVDAAKEQTTQSATTQLVPIKAAPQPEQAKARELPLNEIPKKGNPEIRYEL
ncbi:MAG: hypothetical protein FD167_5107, partial [bacterium]